MEGSTASDSTSALEQFRQQWREEVEARSRQAGKKQSQTQPVQSGLRRREDGKRVERPALKLPTHHPLAEVKDAADASGEEPTGSDPIATIEGQVDDDDFSAEGSSAEPRSALEHYERAVEKESQGSLGDSLSHYRKAYRLDAKVHQTYKNKHFPAKSKAGGPNPSNAAVTVPSTAHHSSKEPKADLNFAEIIATSAKLPILGAEPMIKGDIPPPSPIKDLPQEVLLELLLHIAIIDPAAFARLALVCRKLAYYVFTEVSIWKRIVLGAEFGLAGQQYEFVTDILGRELIYQTFEVAPPRPLFEQMIFSKNEDWREVFHTYPRVRYTGVYISTVNYTRSGGASASQVTWNTPVHIVTYYRYLRFFRDGTCISLLTTSDPMDVVHHLTQENLALVRASGKDVAQPHLAPTNPSAVATGPPQAPMVPLSAQNVMKHALRGRWRLCHPTTDSDLSANDIARRGGSAPGDLHIETEGAGPRYMYTMHLSLKSTARSRTSTKNNKLQWKGFWSHNQLTNDWAEFQLRHDKAFIFSRVKSYGLGY